MLAFEAEVAVREACGARHGRPRLRREEGRAALQPFAKVEPLRFAAVRDDLTPLPEGQREATFSEALGSAALGRRAMVVNEFELARTREPA